jgi:hypothetical protein
MNGHTPYYALSGGAISTTVGPDWAGEEHFVAQCSSDEHARRIVKACNSHAALVEALNEQVSMLRELIDTTLADTTIRDLCLRDTLERGEQALAKAEGKDGGE